MSKLASQCSFAMTRNVHWWLDKWIPAAPAIPAPSTRTPIADENRQFIPSACAAWPDNAVFRIRCDSSAASPRRRSTANKQFQILRLHFVPKDDEEWWTTEDVVSYSALEWNCAVEWLLSFFLSLVVRASYGVSPHLNTGSLFFQFASCRRWGAQWFATLCACVVPVYNSLGFELFRGLYCRVWSELDGSEFCDEFEGLLSGIYFPAMLRVCFTFLVVYALAFEYLLFSSGTRVAGGSRW